MSQKLMKRSNFSSKIYLRPILVAVEGSKLKFNVLPRTLSLHCVTLLSKCLESRLSLTFFDLWR
jgi:hypothetical protein